MKRMNLLFAALFTALTVVSAYGWETTRRCPDCQRENPVEALFCGSCGANLPAERVTIPAPRPEIQPPPTGSTLPPATLSLSDSLVLQRLSDEELRKIILYLFANQSAKSVVADRELVGAMTRGELELMIRKVVSEQVKKPEVGGFRILLEFIGGLTMFIIFMSILIAM